MRVIFLDIDGVLNSASWFKARDKDDSKSESVFEHHSNDLSPWLVTTFESLMAFAIKEEDTRIVLSSTWRTLFDLDEMYRLLDKCIQSHFNRRISFPREAFIDKTPIGLPGQKFSEHIIRGKEIKWWLDNNQRVTSYVILDDDADMLPEQKHNFVHTTWREGMTVQHAMKALRILNE